MFKVLDSEFAFNEGQHHESSFTRSGFPEFAAQVDQLLSCVEVEVKVFSSLLGDHCFPVFQELLHLPAEGSQELNDISTLFQRAQQLQAKVHGDAPKGTTVYLSSPSPEQHVARAVQVYEDMYKPLHAAEDLGEREP